jgi:hydroxymethylpyrimidine/phosphomethylpyrimidine kinase
VKRAARRPTVLLAAGLEGTGRVGLLADVAAVRTAGGLPTAVVTALTAQGPSFRLLAVQSRFLAAQLDAALAMGRPAAVKVGMVPDARTLALLWPPLVALGVPLVVDPVVRTSHGERLSRLLPRDFHKLAAPLVWLTPNVPELAWLLGRRTLPKDVEAVTELARTLLAQGFAAVVVKGGHLEGPATDVLVTAERVVRLVAPRLRRGGGLRGTGCRFASTLATRLALGRDGLSAVREAKRAVRRYLRG